MPILSPPRDAHIRQALTDARTWCSGKTIDERPAFVHAVKVAATIAGHIPNPATDLVVAALLHDSPEFAPPGLDLDHYLDTRYSPQVTRIVRGLQSEHDALDQPDPPVHADDQDVLLASTADRIVAFTSLLRRAKASGSADAFFAVRPALVALLPHFRACHAAAVGHVPHSMSAALAQLLDQLDYASRTRS